MLTIKKLFLLLLLFPACLFADHAQIAIYFKDGNAIEYTADSYWTKYNKHEGYYEYYEKDYYGDHDTVYVCISDYVEMNPASRETKKGDFRTLRDQAKALGHYCHYFDKQHTLTDQYGVSLLHEEVESIIIAN